VFLGEGTHNGSTKAAAAKTAGAKPAAKRTVHTAAK
jgi:hypothetical protein